MRRLLCNSFLNQIKFRIKYEVIGRYLFESEKTSMKLTVDSSEFGFLLPFTEKKVVIFIEREGIKEQK